MYNCNVLDTIPEETDQSLSVENLETFVTHRYNTRSKGPIQGESMETDVE